MAARRPGAQVLTRRFTTEEPAGTAALAHDLGRQARTLAQAGLMLGLLGDLGAGKTLFVRGFFRGLGLPGETPVTSPTFTVAQRFDLPGPLELHHLDLYRLGGIKDLEQAGFEDTCGAGRVTCVEWPERAPGALTHERLEVRLEIPPTCAPTAEPLKRAVAITAYGPRLSDWLKGVVVGAREVGA